MKKTMTVLLFSALMLGCSAGELYKLSTIKPDRIIPAKNFKIIAFFINKEIAWYGETDRNYAKFHDMDPVFTLFSKELLTKVGIITDPKDDFSAYAKTEGIAIPTLAGYTSASGRIIMKRLVDYWPIINKIQAADHFMVIEQYFNIILSSHNNRSALLDLKVFILDKEAKTVFAKRFSLNRPFTAEEYQILVSFQRRNRKHIQDRIMIMYSEMFLQLAGQLAADLQRITRSK